MISVVIPVYNEEEAIVKTLEGLQDVLEKHFKEYEIIVVDDGSIDTTFERIAKAKIRKISLIKHVENLGYGKSLLDGITTAKFSCVAIIDGDGSYDPKDIGKLYPYFSQYDMVVGARQGKEYRRGVWKRPARKFFKILAEYASGRKIPDVNSGLRIFKKEIALDFRDSLCTGFSFTTTMTLIFLLNNYYVKYVPIEYVKREGKTKVNHFRDTFRVGQIIVQAILYYNPIKLFLLIAFWNSLLGGVLAIFNLLFFKSFILKLISAIDIASFLPIFSLGLIADQLKKIYNLNKWQK